MRRKLLLILGIITGLIVTLALVSASLWPVINTVETGKTPQVPDVLPQYFSADSRRVFDEAEASLEALEQFSIVDSDRDAGKIMATREHALGLTTQVVVSVEAQTDFVTVVHIRSTSDFGRGDFGQNARTIRELQGELDRRLGAVRFDPYANGAAVSSR